MALKVLWSKKANYKLDKIILYLENEFGESVAKVFVKKVFDFTDTLSNYPEIGIIQDKTKNIYGFTLIKQINIFYRIKKKKRKFQTL